MATPQKHTRTTLCKSGNVFLSLLKTKTTTGLKLLLFASFLFFSNSKTFSQTEVVNTSTVESGSYTVSGGPKQISFLISGGNGGNGTNTFGGNGANATAIYNLNNGDVIRYLVAEGGGGGNQGGGGGSTGIYINGTLALVAGGGGGGDNSTNAVGLGANSTTNGRNGTNTNNNTPLGGSGGINGNGGTSNSRSGGGGGIEQNGNNGSESNGGSKILTLYTLALGGTTSTNGGNGGRGLTGGGAGGSNYAGGGAGYSGGGAAGFQGSGGGGGSYVNTTLATYVSSTITGGLNGAATGASQTNGANGSVKITILKDTDGDGIADVNDDDSDNDGILDIVECPNFSFSKDLIISNANAGYLTVVGGGAAGSSLVTDAGPNNNETGLRYIDQSSGVTYYRLNTQGKDHTYIDGNNLIFRIFTEDPGEPFFGGTTDVRIGSGTTQYTIDLTEAPYGVTAPSTITPVVTDFTITVPLTADNFGISQAQFNAVISSLDYIDIRAEFYAGARGVVESELIPLENDPCDDDNDGIPNIFDLDSDGDGCFDALEGTGNITANQLTSTGAIDYVNQGGVTAQGVPNAVVNGTSVGQGIGTSQNKDIQSPECNTDVNTENDINQTPKDMPVDGALLTNDENVTSVTSVIINGTATAVPTGTTGITINNVPGVDENGVAVANAGSITIKDDGTYTFTPTTGFTGTINPITYTGEGANNETDTATLNIEVVPNILPSGNNPPTALNDVATTELNTTVNSTILSNDSDPDGDNLTVTSNDVTIDTATTVAGVDENGVAVTNAGSLTLNDDGTYEFVPATGFTGTINDITYTVSDGNGGTDTAILNLNVISNFGNNTFANDDANSAPQGTDMTGSVLANDFDPDLGDTQTVNSASVNGTTINIGTPTVIAGVGSLTLNSNGSYTFVPLDTFRGTIPVKYEICDTGSPQKCDEATLYLTSIPTDVTAENDINQTPKDTTVDGDLLTNDEGITSIKATGFVLGTPTTVSGVDENGTVVANAGLLTLNENGTYSFTPTTGFTGTIDPVTYLGTGAGIGTDSATLSIEVLPNIQPAGNNPPTAQNDVNTTELNTTVNSTILSNDSDPDGDAITITEATTTNEAGVVSPFTLGTAKTVSGIDENGVAVANAGTVKVNADGTYEFVPANNFTGTINDITYTVSDGNGGTDTAILNLNVIPNYGNNTFANDDANSAPQGTTMNGDVVTNDFDPEGNTQTITTASATFNGTTTEITVGTETTIPNVGKLTLNADGTYTFIPEDNFVGTVPVTYSVCDGATTEACDQATLYLTSIPTDVTAENDINQTPQDTTVNGQLITNDQGVTTVTATGFTLGTAKIVSGVDNNGNVVANAGSLTINGNGTYTFVPAAGFTGTIDPITYTGKGAGNGTDTATLSIEVLPNIQPAGNNLPTAQNDVNTTELNTTVNSTILSNDSDPDTGDIITITEATTTNEAGIVSSFTLGTAKTVSGIDENGVAVANAGTVKVNADGTYQLVPANNFTGTINDITYTVSDGNGGTDTAILNLNVIPNYGNNTFANDDANSAPQGTTMDGDVVTNDFDPEGNTQTVTTASALVGTTSTLITIGTETTIPNVGDLTLNADGSYTFEPLSSFVGTVPVTYTKCDNGTPQACDQATLYLTSIPTDITAENDINQTPQDTTVNGQLITNDQGVTTVTATGFTLGTAKIVSGVDNNGNVVANAGSLTINADGTYTFVPAAGFKGTINPVTYTGENAGGATDTATLSIEILPNIQPAGNNPPTAQNDVNTTELNTVVSSTILTNDSDPDTGDTITVTGFTTNVTTNSGATSTPTTVTTFPVTGQTVSGLDKNGNPVDVAGTINFDVNGEYTFTPATGFTGTVNDITYTITDIDGETDTAILNLDVIPNYGNNTFANDDANSAPQGTTMNGDVVTNDFDPEGNTQTVTTASATFNGTTTAITVGTETTIPNVGKLTLNADGTYTFVPETNFVGTVPVTYSVCDNGTPQVCDEATLYLTSIPDDVIAENDINQTPQDTPVDGQLITNDQGVTSVTATGFTLGTAKQVAGVHDNGTAVANAGSLTINADGTYTFIPAAGFTGTIDPVTYTGTGDGTPIDTAILSIEVIPNINIETGANNPPTAQNDVATTEINTTVSSNLFNNDSDPDGDAITVTSATFTRTGTTNLENITVGSQIEIFGINENGNSVPAGNITIEANGDYTYSSTLTFVGTLEPITYTISDGNGGTNTAILSINVINNFGNNTFANDDANSAQQGTTMNGNVVTNDFDPEGNTQTITTASATFNGTTSPVTPGTPEVISGIGSITINTDGSYTFVPEAGFTGTVPVIYNICDNGTPQACDQATLYLTSIPANIAGDVMITQVYQVGTEKWIEITNIGTTEIPANTINIQLYKDKTGDQTGVTPDVTYTVTTLLASGESVLFKNSGNGIENLRSTATIVDNVVYPQVDNLTDLEGGNDIITLSSSTGTSSWANRYDVVSNVTNKTSVVRIDETLTPNKDYTASEWVVFIDDAILPYQPIGDETVAGDKRHPQDPLISEIESSSTEANTLLGLHRINITTSTATNNLYTNGYPDRSRSVVIDQDFEHTGNRLSARKLKVDASNTSLTVTDQLLVVTNDITLDGDIRLAGTLAQLVQTHTGTSTITSTITGVMGKLLVDQNSDIPSLYRYGYMSSPVNSGTNTYTIEDVLKDGTDPSNPKDITFVDGYDGSFTSTGISLADYWIYTYSPQTNGRINYVHKYEDGIINRGDGFIFKGPGKEDGQNYTFSGTPNDGDFNTAFDIGIDQDYLIGNPFPSAINTRKFIEDNLDSTTGTLYFWEHQESELGEGEGIDGHIFGGYIGGYAAINLTTSTAASSLASNNNNGTGGTGDSDDMAYKTPSKYIAIGQGFFIQGDDTGGVINFNNTQRAYVTEGAESVFFKASGKSSKTAISTNLLPIIKLGFEYKNTEELLLHNQIAISFQETNSFAFNKGYDSEVYETGKTDMYFKFPNDDTNYVIAGVQEISNELEVPLELVVDYSGQVNVMVDEIQNVDRDIYITDKLTNTSYNVKQGKATLTLEKGVYTDRFVLAFKDASVLSVEDDILEGYTSIYADNENNNIVISKNQDIEINKVELFDILGKKVSLWNIKEQKSTYQLDIKKQIPTGIYIVKMRTNKGDTNKKVIIE
ncbi:Ig-like domain-containing protein [Polaribacter sejongensis]|uniref:Ig-like domain-containing protein n=2 Tax=Polaribacter sejongensis TaxID=985043 RepID=UPI0021D614BA|nr:Ig-like domain-containing protein [Polaribacter undariae]